MTVPAMVKTYLNFQPKRYSQMECSMSLAKFTLVFYHHFLALNNQWFSSFKRFYQVLFLDNRPYYIVKTVILHDHSEVCAFGASFNKDSASDVSCYFLSSKLRELKRNFMMPKYLLGYPNFTGYCFLISAILPLFHCYPFICKLFNYHLDFSIKFLAGDFHYNSEYNFDEEVPFFWVDLLFRTFTVYQDFASCEEISNDFSRLYHILSNKVLLKDIVWNDHQRNCIELIKMLDETLSKDLAASITKYCDPIFCLDGGDERQMITALLTKIASEIPDFHQDFALRFTCNYNCTTCSDGPFVDNFYSLVLRVHPSTDFQDFLNDPVKCFSKQRFRSIHDVSGHPCNSRIHSVSSCIFTNVPEILIFAVSYFEEETFLVSPQELTLNVFSKEYTYSRLSYSVCFPCFIGKDGKDYECFYHPYEPGDVCLGEHTYVHLETKAGLYEVNNGAIYEADLRLKNKVMPGSVHFYQLKKYFEFIPEIEPKNVLCNPLY